MEHFGATLETFDSQGRVEWTGQAYYNYDVPVSALEPTTSGILGTATLRLLVTNRRRILVTARRSVWTIGLYAAPARQPWAGIAVMIDFLAINRGVMAAPRSRKRVDSNPDEPPSL